ncbi:hypothetical protein [Acinetobacter schindleri]|nr:hypothetical protein [Acinetobacter schindleri]
MLNRKTQVSGIEESEKLFFEMVYLMIWQRLNFIGDGALDEIRNLVDQVERDAFPERQDMIPVCDFEFFESSGMPS